MKRLAIAIAAWLAVLTGVADPQSNQQISFSNLVNQLPVGPTPLNGTEPMIVVQSGVAHQVPSNAIASLVNTGLLVPPIKTTVRTATSTNDNVLTSDYFVCANNMTVAATENMPQTPTVGWTFLIKDCTGNASAHTITINGNGLNVDGSSTFAMTIAYQSVAITFTGSQWSLN